MSSIIRFEELPSLEMLFDYFDGILGSSASAEIERKIASSEELKLIVNGIEQYYKQVDLDRDKTEAYIQKLQIGFKKKPVKNTYFKIDYKIKAAAAILVIGIVSAVFYIQNVQPILPQLVEAELSEPYAAPNITRSNVYQDELTSLWTKAATSYATGNYEKAIDDINQIDSLDGDDPTSWFYLGLCNLYVQNTNYELAIKYFRQVEETSHVLSDRAKWFLALSYINLKNKELAKPLLYDLAKKNGFKSKRATEILENI